MKKFKILPVLLIFIMLAGCSEDYLEEAPPHLFSSELLLQSYDGFENALNGLYEIVRTGRWQSEKIENAINGTDNGCSNYGRGDVYYYWGDTNSASDSRNKELFAWCYEIIYSANNIITFAEKEGVDFRGGGASHDENKNRIVAEARAMRGFAYRRLAFSYGDVPLSLELITGIVTNWERAPVADVWAAVIADFKFAQEYIPDEASLQGRITKGAVQTLLAETYLTVDKPDSALIWANMAIDNPAYELTTERYGVFKDDAAGSAYGDMFKATPLEGNQNREDGNKEALWVWQFELYSNDGRGHEMSRAITGNYNQIIINNKKAISYKFNRGGRGKSYFGCTKWYIDSFEPQDVRGQNYILRRYFILSEEVVNNEKPDVLPDDTYSYGDTIWCDWSREITFDDRQRPDWPYSRKGEGTDPDDMAADFAWSDQIYLRLADTYLLKAEAQYKLGDAADAATTINIIRSRANASAITAADVDIDFILDERSRELYPEEDRRYTLLRTGKWLERVRKHNKNGGDLVSERDVLFPIPQSVIDANLTLPMENNPGWD